MPIVKTIAGLASINITDFLLLFFALFIATFFALAESDREVSRMIKKYSLGVMIAGICIAGMVVIANLLILGQIFALLAKIPLLTSNLLIGNTVGFIVILMYIFLVYLIFAKIKIYLANREVPDIRDDDMEMRDILIKLESTINQYAEDRKYITKLMRRRRRR